MAVERGRKTGQCADDLVSERKGHPNPRHTFARRAFIHSRQNARLSLRSWGPAMTVKIDGVEPNIFASVEHLDARDAGRNVEVFIEVRIEGKPTPVTVKLSYPQAAALADLLEPFRSLAI